MHIPGSSDVSSARTRCLFSVASEMLGVLQMAFIQSEDHAVGFHFSMPPVHTVAEDLKISKNN